MVAISGVFRWLGRKGIVFVALVAAILIYWSTKPSFEGFRQLRETAAMLSQGEGELRRQSATNIARSNADAAAFHRLSRGQIVDRLAAARREREPLIRACGSDLAALATEGARGVIENRRQCLRAKLLTCEIDTLIAMHGSLDARRPGETVSQALQRQVRVMHGAAAVYRDAGAKFNTLDSDYMPDILQRDEMQQQRTRMARAQTYFNSAKRNQRALVGTQRSIAHASRAADGAVAEAHRQYRMLVDGRAKALSDNILHKTGAWAETNNLVGAVKWAAGALALIIAMPYLIRLICYFVLAPAVMRRPVIRLGVPGGAGVAIPPADRSTTSVGVKLAAGEELLVRQDYLQTTSHAAAKGTQWFLDWRHPITSIATGLTFLTRIRGEGEVTTVSAVQNPFAEVTVVTLPEGAACVLQPRALAAVAQPSRRPLRVTGHWRLFSLNAWLTMQLRYLVFHGPARLVIMGGRGVRVERAEQGRIFGQHQLVGFSCDLAYSVTRVETFWPYFFGREQLLKDRVEPGEGILIIEEAPMAGRRAGEAPGGIEGLLDAGMKAFGM